MSWPQAHSCQQVHTFQCRLLNSDNICQLLSLKLRNVLHERLQAGMKERLMLAMKLFTVCRRQHLPGDQAGQAHADANFHVLVSEDAEVANVSSTSRPSNPRTCAVLRFTGQARTSQQGWQQRELLCFIPAAYSLAGQVWSSMWKPLMTERRFAHSHKGFFLYMFEIWQEAQSVRELHFVISRRCCARQFHTPLLSRVSLVLGVCGHAQYINALLRPGHQDKYMGGMVQQRHAL
jgi:hypothetical protein